jgi:hypothetical protein
VSQLRYALSGHDVLAAGTFAGVLGGIGMIVVAMIGAANQGVSPAHPLMVIGETFVGPEALAGGPKLAFGALVHVLTSAGLGVVVVALIPREYRPACAMGLAAGLVLFAMGFMMSTLVPWVNPGLRGSFQVIGGTWVVAHVVYGVTLGLAPALRRWLARETIEATARPAPGSTAAVPRARTTVT